VKECLGCCHWQMLSDPALFLPRLTLQMNSLLCLPSSPPGGPTKWFITVLSILAPCNLTSVESVRRTLDFALSMGEELDGSAESLVTKRSHAGLPNELIDVLSAVGDKCASVLRVNSSLSRQLADAIGGSANKQEIRRALRLGKAYTKASTSSSTAGAVTSAFARLVGSANVSTAAAIDGGVSEASVLLAEQFDMTDSGVITSNLKAVSAQGFQTMEIGACL